MSITFQERVLTELERKPQTQKELCLSLFGDLEPKSRDHVMRAINKLQQGKKITSDLVYRKKD